jgi:DNA repair protein RecN (Recombination protein N)
MLSRLKIQNYALINDIEIDFSEGFIVITGETGAGKSILLGALGLILGNRVDNSIFRNLDKKCIIEGVFSISTDFQEFFDQNELDFSTSTIIRREIYPDGRSRAFVNDTPVQINILKELSEKIIDIHSQHQTIRLNDTSFQLAILDSFAHNSELLSNYKQLFREYRHLNRKLAELQLAESKAKTDYDYITFQLNEIEKAELEPDEDKLLEEDLAILTNAEKIQSALAISQSVLYDDEESVNNKLSEIVHQLSAVSGFSHEIEEYKVRMMNLIPEIRDIYNALNAFQANVDVDQQKLEEMNNRLSLINHLLLKHQMQNLNSLLNYAEGLRMQLNNISSLESDIEQIKKQEQILYEQLKHLSDQITELRNNATSAISEELIKLLMAVGMKNAGIKFDLAQSEYSELNENGRDRLNILFSSNKGVPLLPVNKVASGGELSRLMLCLKYILTESTLLPTIIFDEIDMGISGEVAIQVGKMIRKLSLKHQVICITHLPQIAAMAQQHLMVYKTTDDHTTSTRIKYLEGNDKVMEIAKMIGGDHPAETHINTSKQLIEQLTLS